MLMWGFCVEGFASGQLVILVCRKILCAESACLRVQTLPVTARHANGDLEYNMHNLYGHTMATTTHAALQSVNDKRPFILTR